MPPHVKHRNKLYGHTKSFIAKSVCIPQSFAKKPNLDIFLTLRHHTQYPLPLLGAIHLIVYVIQPPQCQGCSSISPTKIAKQPEGHTGSFKH